MIKNVKKTKKRGKYKKRKIKKEPKKRVYCKHSYQIVLLNNNKQIDFISSFPSELKANKAFIKLLDENKKVIFPKLVNNGNEKKLIDAKYELAIIKKREENEPKTTMLRNEYGDLVEHNTNSEDWIIYDKKTYNIEESFWVYGYHPLVQRKDFLFIFNEIVKPKTINKGDMLNIMVFKNKVLFETLEGHLDMVICKNVSDAIRLYNLLEEWCVKNKETKYYLFNGNWSISFDRMVEKIHNLTNWNKKKITRSNTKP